MVLILRERGPRPVGVSAELGSRPLHSTSVGRAYLVLRSSKVVHKAAA